MAHDMTNIPADAFAVNFMRLAGLSKEKARECEQIARQVLAAQAAAPSPTPDTKEALRLVADALRMALTGGRVKAHDAARALAAADAILSHPGCEPDRTHCARCNNNVFDCPQYQQDVAESAARVGGLKP